MKSRNSRVPPPWGDDLEEALRTQDEETQRQSVSSPSGRWSSRSRLHFRLGVIFALALVWYLIYYALLSRNL
jgi:hypothetical protein